MNTICEACALAVGGCTWSDSLEPVEGWEADQPFDGNGQPYSYAVIKCPLFVKGMRRTVCHPDGMINLLEAAMKQIYKDYPKENAARRAQTNEFIRKFCPDPEAVIDYLRKEAIRKEKDWDKLVRDAAGDLW